VPFIAQHVRLANSGKTPDLFLTSKAVAPTELADAALGKLYFVIQINLPWSHASSIGTSLMNVVSREYYRQEGSVPLENFERAIAKANRLVEQLSRDGDSTLPQAIHALIGLAVGDDFHLAVCGEAEAYFLRDNSFNLITDPGRAEPENGQIFPSLISGELSVDDIILLGSPGLYGSLTTDELHIILKQPLSEASMALARRLKSLKAKKVNAILVGIKTVQSAENDVISANQETIYLDQALDSTWTIVTYYLGLVTKPLGKLADRLADLLIKHGGQFWHKKAKPALDKSIASTATKFKETKLPKLPELKPVNFKSIQEKLPKFTPEVNEAGVPVHHYTSRRPSRSLGAIGKVASLPLQLVQDLGRQFRVAFKRSPRIWYIIIALILLSSLGASIQTRKANSKQNPIATAATLDSMKSLIDEAKQAKIYGNDDKARELYLQAIAKGEEAQTNAKLVDQAKPLVTSSKKELYSLSGATEVVSLSPLLTIDKQISHAAIYEGTLYSITNDGRLFSTLLTGGEATELATLPDGQAANQLLLLNDAKLLIIQTYTGDIYHYDITTKKLKHYEPAEDNFTPSTGLGFYNDTLYLLDPANNQINKYAYEKDSYSAASSYIKNKKVDLSDTKSLVIDGSLFALHKTGAVTKFVRGAASDFTVKDIPKPFDTIVEPLGFFADEAADSYYLVDKGDKSIGARLIELNSTGAFMHQYLFPEKWQDKIKLVMASPRTHKVWVLVDKELFEFTLVQ
jgi:hypothetical protein